MTPEFELGRDFVYNALIPKFHHPVFTRSKVIVLTSKQASKQNKQTPLETSDALSYVGQ